MDVEQRDSIASWKKAIWTISFAVLLGTIGSGIWDVIARPGMGGIGRLCLRAITFGSTTLQDAAYANAALDPTAIPSLVFLQLVNIIPMALITYLLSSEVLIPILRSRKGVPANSEVATTSNEVTTSRSRLTHIVSLMTEMAPKSPRYLRRRRREAAVMIALLVVLWVLWLAYVGVINQSVIVRRVFDADVAICAPYLSEREEELLRAEFAGVKTRADFQPIAEELKRVADENQLHLRDECLW